MKAATPTPTSGGGAPATDVAGATGGGATTAAAATTAPASAVGIGDLSGLLKQLTDAVALLGKAIASMQGGAVGGGGPIQMPPGKGVVIQGGGPVTNSPSTVIRSRLDKADATPTLSATAKAALAPIRAEFATFDAQAARDGAFNPGASLRLGAMIDAAVLPANDPRLSQLTKIIADARTLEAKAVKVGSYDAIEIQRLDQVYQAVMSQGPRPVA